MSTDVFGELTAPAPPRWWPGRRLAVTRAVAFVTIAIYVVAGLLTSLALPGHHQITATGFAWALGLMAAFALAEVMVLHLEWSGHAYSLSLSELPLMVGLFFCPLQLLVIARVIGGCVALALHRKQPLQKLTFNVGVLFLEASLAAALFVALPSHGSNQLTHGGLTALLAVTVATAASVAAVCLVVRLSVGRLDRAVILNFVKAGTVGVVANGSAALVILAALSYDPWSMWPLLVVIGTMGAGYRAYISLRHRHANLELLYDFTKNLDRSATQERRVRDLLDRTREMLRGEIAEITLLEDKDAEGATRRWVAVADTISVERYTADMGDWPLARVVAEDQQLVIRRGVRDRGLARFLEERQLRDCVLAPLHSDDRVIGTIMVANRDSDIATFTADDGRLLSTVAAQVSRALENGWLLDKLTHDSLHDTLTGLVNRNCYQTRLREALANTTTPRLAVMLMDLDRFKEVNDTLGHHHGDLLIREIASRLQESAPPGATVARLGGDEFALLLPDADAETAEHVATLLREAVAVPCHLDGVTVEVEVSLGIAVAPIHGVDDSVLLKRSDMAMYAAKSSGTGIEFYDSERDSYSPRRLALASQLRKGIESGELVLHYQPLVRTGDGRITGVEALVRWQHPDYGMVSPAEFVPIAEQSGAIGELTGWVLGEATRQLAEWRSDGYTFGVSVNLSMRNLLDTGVADLLGELLRERGLPGSCLTLEITESHIMADTGRTLPILHRLADLGTRLSIDDFGTGYSSLAYLKQLPVDELKIDRSFVTALAKDEADVAIVRAIVTLAQSLSLSVIAEGVEDLATLKRLASLGCDYAQGYAISPPLPAGELRGWLAAQPILPRQATGAHDALKPRLALG